MTILWCKGCNRYLQPPKHWVRAELESKELLTFCIKRIKGLGKMKLVDAGFIWTEPHSKRLKLKLTVQAEVFNGAILQQTFVVDFVVEDNMCTDCSKHAANPNQWVAVAQVRQHTHHKRTFMFLEQLILKHGVDQSCTNVKEIHEGVDFFFGNRQHAVKFIDFLGSVVPVRYRSDKQLVSHNIHSATYNYKYTFSVEIVPICKDDLIFLPRSVAKSFGELGPLMYCTRVSSALHLTDPITLRSIHLEAGAYWRAPFRALMTSKQLIEYVVLDIEPADRTTGRFSLARAEVARVADFGKNDTTLTTLTHLGNVLHPGDRVLGYDLLHANLVDDAVDLWLERPNAQLPDVVLVRKSYEQRRARRRARGEKRPWQLKRMDMESEEAAAPTRAAERKAAAAAEDDMERFLEELEEDPEMRQRVALFKDANYDAAAAAAARMSAMTEDEEDDLPEVPLEELLDDLMAMTLDAREGGTTGEDTQSGAEGRHSEMDMA